MPWKPKLVFCTALTFLSLALVSRRAGSIGLISVAETSSPPIEFLDEDLDVSLEDEASPVLQRHGQSHHSSDSPLTAVSDSDDDISIPTAPPSKSHPPCFPDQVLLVSTMDGKISALDLERLEKPIWSVGTGSKPSSTPEPLLATNNVKIDAGTSWVIPSLDGMLHKFDITSDEKGEHLRSTATSSEEILERSIRLDEENLASSARTGLTIYGSKEVTLIGINARNGHVCYFCDGSPAEHGCSADRADIDDCGLTDEDDVIVVRRVSHSVKALRTRTGEQRWNYSVAQNHLRLEEGPGIGMDSHFPPSTRSTKNDVVITTCDKPSSAGNQGLRFDVLEGRVHAGDSRRYDFGVPIASAWLVSEGKLIPINLFDTKNLATQSSNPSNFLTFVGSFNNQYYLQHSDQFHDLVSLRNGRQPNNRELEWRSGPRGITAGSSKNPALTYDKMTPAVGHTRIIQDSAVATWLPGINPGDYLRPVNEYQLEVELSKLSGASSWWRQFLKLRNFFVTSPYISMGVSFLISSVLVLFVTFAVQCKQRIDLAMTRDKSPGLSKMPSVTDSGFENSAREYRRSESRSIGGCHSMPILSQYDSSPQDPPVKKTLPDIFESGAVKPDYLSSPSSPSSIEFDSRFYQDFEPMKCLGKGGFGVVFEAKNRLDDCAYAIKRIALKNKAESKERVRREVMALAKLDHIGIVRYYHAWFESPPIGWDDPFLSHLTSLSTDMFSPTSSGLEQVLCTVPDINAAGERGGVSSAGGFAGFENGSGDAPQKQGKKKKKRDRYESLATKDLIFNNNHPEDSFDNDVSLLMGNDSAVDDGQSGRFPPPVPVIDSSDGISFRDDLDCSAIKGGSSKFFHRADSRIQSSPTGSTLRRSDTISPSDSGLEFLPRSKSDNLNISEESFDIVFERDTRNASSEKFGVFLSSNNDNEEEEEEEDSEDEEQGGPKGFFPVPGSEGNLKKEKTRPPRLSGGERKSSSEKIFLYIQMQLCLKETLKDWLRVNLQRRHASVLDIFAQIVDAVQFLHNLGLIHRDLKPSNIFFSASDGTVKIGDFGLVTAMVLDEPCLEESANLQVHTLATSKTTSTTAQQHTDQVGTKLYMSPEQSAGDCYSEKVDIYALGIIFFELLHPFQTEMERGQTLTALRQDSVIPQSLRRAKKKESGLLLQMIHQDASKRPSAEEIRLTVEDLENDEEDEAVGEDDSFRGRRRRNYSRGSSNKSGGSVRSLTDNEEDKSDAEGDEDFLIEFADDSR